MNSTRAKLANRSSSCSSSSIPSTVVVGPISDRSSSRITKANTTATSIVTKKKKTLKDLYYDERSREKQQQYDAAHPSKKGTKVVEVVPSITPMTEDACSVDDSVPNTILPATSRKNRTRQWDNVYIPKPLFDSSFVVVAGIVLYIIAVIWPPLLLILAIVGSYFVQYCFRENDCAVVRRELYQEFILHAGDNLPADFAAIVNSKQHYDPCSTLDHHTDEDESHQDNDADDYSTTITSKVRLRERFWTNSRGMQLNTIMMTPSHTDKPITAVICFCHGYSDNASYTKLIEYQKLVLEGNIAFVAIEYEGHGRSDGLLAYIEDWNVLIDDVTNYFSYVMQHNPLLQNKPTFLMGESMGGAIAYDVYNRIPDIFTKGVIFVCPMCKISDDMLPSPIIVDCLKRLLEVCPWLGYLPIAPCKNSLHNVCYKEHEKRIQSSLSPFNYSRSPRLATARELVDATQRISESLYDFDAPFLIVHGKADVVTCPGLSQQLYDECKSMDKTIQLYDDMWHSLIGGEPDENVEIVLNDIIQWIQHRV